MKTKAGPVRPGPKQLRPGCRRDSGGGGDNLKAGSGQPGSGRLQPGLFRDGGDGGDEGRAVILRGQTSVNLRHQVYKRKPA